MIGVEKLDNIIYKGRDFTIDEFLKEIFDEVPETRIKLSVAELKKYAAAEGKDIFVDKDLENFKTVESVEDLKAFIMNPSTQNLGVKELLQACLTDKGVAFNDKAIKSCGKVHVSAILENIFDFNEELGIRN